jgi:cellulose synthase/poly-beta-1,6-N-acetylglucosamine synthase-like glycosyltransferase
MNGFFYYFFSVVDPTANLGFSRGLPELMTSAFVPWWLMYVVPVLIWFLPSVLCWLVYLVAPVVIRPTLPARRPRTEPFVSVVIAGRNESASIGQAIRAALLCGYANLEVVFVDDCSDDDSVAIARQAARSITGRSSDTDRVRIFASPRRNGKASTLNIGIRMARGEFIAIIDADSAIQYGAMQHWLLPFGDPRVGAVCANIRVLNSTASLLTRLQEIEYAMQFTVGRLAAARVGILPIIPGIGGLFRAEIVRRLGGIDTGLGDDTDLTMKLRKQRWKLGMSLDAVVWTIVPVTRRHLWRQRTRWERNMVKIRLSKHRDQFILGRYGLANAFVALQLLFVRLTLPWMGLIGLLFITYVYGPLAVPRLLTDVYWIYLIYLLIKSLIARDISRTPQPNHFWLLSVFPFYRLSLRLPVMYAQFCELFRIGAKHPYVPDHIWQEIPWW